jgi:DNA-binding response OmpR family regulator
MAHRILIADDSPVIRELLAELLNTDGYAVTVVEDGLAAWEEVSRDVPSMVVLDIEMPHLDGCEVCRRIKSQPGTRGVPVLLVSGCPETALLAQGAGADGFLNKPFYVDDLRGQIAALLGRSVPQQAGLTVSRAR